MKFVADNQPAEPVQPGEQPLHHPAAQVAAQRSAVLSLAPVLTVGRDHFDSVFLIKMSVERVRVVRLVTNQLLRQFVEEAAVSSTSFDSCGEAESIRDSQRNAVSGGDGHRWPMIPSDRFVSGRSQSHVSMAR
jgi:hypothetical protein